MEININQLLDLTIQRSASDLHLVMGYYPTIRIDGDLYQINTLPLLTKEINQSLLTSILSDEQKATLFANKELDLAYEYNNFRFRANLYYAREAISGSFRLIPAKIKTLEELELPSTLHNIKDIANGLVLMTGPTGQGKTTTLASILNEINQGQSRHIITVEDPIEYVYPKAKSIISQREIHQDTLSWRMALRSILREDPDVVFTGEIRDYETAQIVLNIAETGHLVFSTLHTISAPETVDRFIGMFPADQQNLAKAQLASILRVVITQRLLPRAQVRGRVPAVEVLFNNRAVASIIREGKPYLLDNVLQTSEAEGFVFFEKYLAKLYSEGKISDEIARQYAIRPKELDKYITK